MLDETTMHTNFVLIHNFLYPQEALKTWVKEDATHTGSYHDDWNWLMPVVEKIENFGYEVLINGNWCTIYSDEAEVEFERSTKEGKIWAVYFAVLDLIEYHNLETRR